MTDAAAATAPWPAKRPEPAVARILFKYAAGQDWFRVTLAFYSCFRSDRQSVLFHPLGGGAEWAPFTCPAVARARDRARDARDRMFLEFIAWHYCAG